MFRNRNDVAQQLILIFVSLPSDGGNDVQRRGQVMQRARPPVVAALNDCSGARVH